MTQGPTKIPPGVPAAVVGSVDHHDLSAHRHPKAPFGDPAVGGESINHHERTVQNKVFFESVHKAEVGGKLAPLLIRLLLCLLLLALPRALALLVQRASRIAIDTILILPRVARLLRRTTTTTVLTISLPFQYGSTPPHPPPLPTLLDVDIVFHCPSSTQPCAIACLSAG